jgi:hypothetical protein
MDQTSFEIGTVQWEKKGIQGQNTKILLLTNSFLIFKTTCGFLKEKKGNK